MLVILVAVIGACVLVYPTAAQWFAAWNTREDVNGYVHSVASLPDPALAALRQRAHDYNDRLPVGQLRDPYAVGAPAAPDEALREAREALAVSGTDVVARLRIPAIDVDLSVLLGSNDTVFARGIGLMLGSSLPVGGPGTHAVLSGHSAYVGSTLLDHLDQVVEGDHFIIDSLGEQHHYRVDRLEVVVPTQTGSLQIVPGLDQVTLVTCTPKGINSHRLLVHGVRIDAPEWSPTTTVLDPPARPGFPWWALVIAGTGVVGFVLVRPPRRASAGPAEAA